MASAKNRKEDDDTPSPKIQIVITRRDTQITFYRRCCQLFAIIRARLRLCENQVDVRFPTETMSELANSLTAQGKETPPVILIMSKSLRQSFDANRDGFLVPFAGLLGLPMRKCLALFDTGEWWDSHPFLKLSWQIDNGELNQAYEATAEC